MPEQVGADALVITGDLIDFYEGETVEGTLRAGQIEPFTALLSQSKIPVWMTLGNHDIQRGRRDHVEKEGMVAREGLILRHARTGQRIFVVHGHQADFKSDCLYIASRFVVRHIWKRLQLLDVSGVTRRVGHSGKQGKIEQTIIGWVRAYQQIVI